jgi:hypothetical protein
MEAYRPFVSSPGDAAIERKPVVSALDIARKLAAKDADCADAQADVVVSLFKLAKVGDDPPTHLRETLAILDALDKAGSLPPDKQPWRGFIEDALKPAAPK